MESLDYSHAQELGGIRMQERLEDFARRHPTLMLHGCNASANNATNCYHTLYFTCNYRISPN